MSMKWEDKGLKSPLARARGLGSARSVVDGWISLRVTAIANAIASVWFIWFLSQVIGQPYGTFIETIADPRNAVMMILFIISGFYHTALGLREVIEDYVQSEWFKISKLVGSYLFYFAAATACIFSVLKISFVYGI